MKHLVLLAAFAVCGCGPTYHAHLDDGAGLAEGSPVLVSSVNVGNVESVRVVDGHVDVAFAIDRKHEVTLRTDACAIARRAQEGREAALIVVPGTGAMREDDEVPIAPCRIDSADVGDLLHSLGEGMGGLMRQLGQGLGQGLFGGGNAAPSLPSIPLPTIPSAPLPSTPVTTGDPCGAVHFRLARVEPLASIPLMLPRGGHRVWLDVSNESDVPMSLGPASAATFTDSSHRAFTVVNLPGGPDAWLMPFDVPPHTSRRVSVVLASDERGTPQVSDITAPSGDPLAECTIRQPVLSP